MMRSRLNPFLLGSGFRSSQYSISITLL
ncbi:hypothetical protein LINPERHAP2_LOCUS11424 [Linum perenne]